MHMHTCLWCRIEINGRPLPVQSNLLCILREMRYFGLPNCSASPPPANFTPLCANPVGDVVPTGLTIQSWATTLFSPTTNDSVIDSAGLGVLVVLIVLTIIIILLVGIIVFQFRRKLRGMLQPSGKNGAKGTTCISGEWIYISVPWGNYLLALHRRHSVEPPNSRYIAHAQAVLWY